MMTATPVERLSPDDVRRIREWARKTRREFAAILHVSHDTVRSWERPIDDPNYRTIPRWASVAIREIEVRLFRGETL